VITDLWLYGGPWLWGTLATAALGYGRHESAIRRRPAAVRWRPVAVQRRVSRNTAPAAPAQNIGVTAINKAELICCDVRTGT